MIVYDTIARPYAKAIFEIAVSEKSIKKWKEMLIIINKITSLKKIQRFLSGSLSPKFLSSFFIFVAGDYLDKYGQNLIKLLAENQRFIVFKNILQEFLKLEMDHKNTIVVKLTSAILLDNKKIISIRSILEKKLCSKIKFIYKINANIINGIIIKIHNTVFNFSAQHYLQKISDTLHFKRI